MARGVVYFALVFGVGFILGPIRVLWLEPRLGQRSAELIETPLMLVAIYFAAGFVIKRFEASRRVEYLYSGLVALSVLLVAEFTVVLALRGLSVQEYLAQSDPVADAVYVVMLIIFAVMPWHLGKRHDAA